MIALADGQDFWAKFRVDQGVRNESLLAGQADMLWSLHKLYRTQTRTGNNQTRFLDIQKEEKMGEVHAGQNCDMPKDARE